MPSGPSDFSQPKFPLDCRVAQCEDAFENQFECCVRLCFHESVFPCDWFTMGLPIGARMPSKLSEIFLCNDFCVSQRFIRKIHSLHSSLLI